MTDFIIKWFGGAKKDTSDRSSEFSKFFRNASSREKKRVFLDVAKRSAEEQRRVLENV